MVIMVTNTTMVMTESKGNGFTTIPVRFETKQKLALLLPKGWDWDRAVLEICDMLEQNRGKVIRSGKPSQDNQTS
jgi:hypothetical protein